MPAAYRALTKGNREAAALLCGIVVCRLAVDTLNSQSSLDIGFMVMSIYIDLKEESGG